MYANESSDGLYQEIKVEAETQTDSSQITKILNLTVDSGIINEADEQQNAVIKKSKQLLPDIFKDKPEKDISIDGGVLINDEAGNSEIIDGVGVSIKVKTD